MTVAEFMALPYSKRARVLRRLGPPSGEWLARMPQKCGWYPVADRQGVSRGVLQVVRRNGASWQAGRSAFEPGWAGLWWSEAIDLPAGPSEDGL